MPKITVILPSLNVAPYIGKCLEDVCGQSFRDFEILAVDAGSVDGTQEIIKEYAANDKRIKLINSDRKSYGYQVNLGIQAARGEYLTVVETDDFPERDMLAKLYRTAHITGADYVKGDHRDVVFLTDGTFWENTVSHLEFNRNLYHKIIVPSEHPEIIRHDIYYWGALYRKDFIDKNGIRMNESNGAAFQDAGFLFQTLTLARKAVYLNQPVYCYRRGNPGASIFNPKGYSFLSGEYTFIEQLMSSGHKENFERILPFYYGRLFDQLAGRVKTMASQENCWEGIEEAVQSIRERLTEGYQNGKLDSGVTGKSLWKEVIMFLDRPEDYITYQRYIYNSKRRILNDLVKKLDKYRHIVIYSCGKLAQFACCLLQKRGIAIEAFCDNNMMKWQTAYNDKEIISVEESVSKYPDAVFLIANNHYLPEMKKQLLALGIPEENVCIFDLEYDLLLVNM